MNIYQLTTDFDNYMNAETDEEIAMALAEITAGQIEKKAESFCKFLANVESDIEAYKAEEKRLSTNRKSLENKVARSKEFLKSALLAGNIDKLTAGVFKISVAKTAGSLVIENPDLVPNQYKDIVQTVVCRNADIKADLAAGIEVPGAFIQSGYSLRIK